MPPSNKRAFSTETCGQSHASTATATNPYARSHKRTKFGTRTMGHNENNQGRTSSISVDQIVSLVHSPKSHDIKARAIQSARQFHKRCPFCLRGDCFGRCGVQMENGCWACGRTTAGRNSHNCTYKISFRCRSCRIEFVRARELFQPDRHACANAGRPKPKYDEVGEKGKEVKTVLRDAVVCYSCYDPTCRRNPCGRHASNRIHSLIVRLALKHGCSVIDMVKAIYSSELSQDAFFANLPWGQDGNLSAFVLSV